MAVYLPSSGIRLASLEPPTTQRGLALALDAPKRTGRDIPRMDRHDDHPPIVKAPLLVGPVLMDDPRLWIERPDPPDHGPGFHEPARKQVDTR